MSSDIEAAGAAVTAGLVAGAIERPERGKGAHVTHGPCVNCGAELSGNFCASCGQPAHIHRSLIHMGEEFLHGIFHLDTRAWRTVPALILRPGTLTRNYIRGMRARYVSPLAMYLLAVFAMFYAFELTATSRGQSIGAIGGVERVAGQIEGLKGTITGLKATRDQLPPDGQAKIDKRIAETETALKLMQTELAREQAQRNTPDQAPKKSIYDDIREGAQKNDFNFKTGWRSLDDNIQQKLQNPELAFYKIQNAASHYAFLLAPISLPFVWLLFFWKRGVSLFDHTVYILYSLSFAALMVIAIVLLGMISGAMDVLGWPLAAGWLAHSFFELKGSYGLGWFSTIWRMAFLLVFELICLIVFLCAILVLGLAS